MNPRAMHNIVVLLVAASCSRPMVPHSSTETSASPSAGAPAGEETSAPPARASAPPPSASATPRPSAPPPSADAGPTVPANPRSTLLPRGAEQDFYESLQKIVLETSGFSNRFEVVEARRVHFPRADRIVVMLKVEPEVCAFGVVEPETGNGFYVPGIEFDCKDVHFVADDDFNEDGVPDFQYHLVVRSNRYDADVDEGTVFLSDRERNTYCYSERLRLLTGRGGWTRSILPDVRARAELIGPRAFECGTTVLP